MKPNKYQQDILDWVSQGKGNATCGAVAGSGKSSTLLLVAQQLIQSGLRYQDIKIVVFGTQNKKDLIDKFGKEWKYSIQTLHSVGYRNLQKEIGRFNRSESPKSNKYRKIAEDLHYIPNKRKSQRYKPKLVADGSIIEIASFVKLIDLVRLTQSIPSKESIRQLTSHFNLEGIENYYKVAEAIDKILTVGQTEAIDNHNIDFADMVWLPVEWGLGEKNWFQKYKFVLVDECQDLNAIQLELSLMLRAKDGRILFVGDEKQAIYGFAGADNNSYQKIIKRTESTELQLDLCYRCPKSHINLVNSIFPKIPIKALDSAPEGIIESIATADLWDEEKNYHLKIGDLVLSRKTAPLVSLCIRLIAKGIAATVKGRDVGRQIKSELQEISKITGFIYDRFNAFLDVYKKFKYKAYKNKDNEEQLKQNLDDKLDALSTIYTSQPNAKSILDLEHYIDDLFSDEESPITLATCHKAKGLENERIFLLKAEDMPMHWEKQLQWQKDQENNLLYVALTRSKSELYILGEPEWFKEKEEKPSDSKETVNKQDSLKEKEEATAEKKLLPSGNVGTNDLHNNKVPEILLLIQDSLDFKSKCELFTLLEKEVNEEKRQQAVKALKEDPGRSDRLIASLCGVSTPFISKIRKNLLESKEIEAVRTRLDKRGRKQTFPPK
ncbi:MAG: UvrD-helicase domain-containing protein [Xenococcus sp. (in: cyanobacteria)]